MWPINHPRYHLSFQIRRDCRRSIRARSLTFKHECGEKHDVCDPTFRTLFSLELNCRSVTELWKTAAVTLKLTHRRNIYTQTHALIIYKRARCYPAERVFETCLICRRVDYTNASVCICVARRVRAHGWDPHAYDYRIHHPPHGSQIYIVYCRVSVVPTSCRVK